MEGKCTGNTETGGCCGGCSQAPEELDLSSLGPEAADLAKKFDRINDNLVDALQTRKEIIEMLHGKASESPEMKDEMDRVVRSRHPVLLQFVFGSE